MNSGWLYLLLWWIHIIVCKIIICDWTLYLCLYPHDLVSNNAEEYKEWHIWQRITGYFSVSHWIPGWWLPRKTFNLFFLEVYWSFWILDPAPKGTEDLKMRGPCSHKHKEVNKGKTNANSKKRPVAEYCCYKGCSHSLHWLLRLLQTSSTQWTLKDFEAVDSFSSTCTLLWNRMPQSMLHVNAHNSLLNDNKNYDY